MTALYYYTARDEHGVFVRGSIEAATQAAAHASLRARALAVTSLQDGSSPAGAIASALSIGSVPRKHLVALFRSLAVLIRAGVSLRRSLDVAIDQCGNRRLHESLACVRSDVENGLTLSDALERHPREFPRLFSAMVSAGELGGILDDVLERLACVLERDFSMRKRLLSALAYPAIVGVCALTLVGFLLACVLPNFAGMYAQMHVPVPRMTAALLVLAQWIRMPSFSALVVCLAIAAAGAAALLGSARCADIREALIARLPLAGPIVRKNCIARMARMLGTLLTCGVPVLSALDVVREVIDDRRYRENVNDLSLALAQGAGFSQTLAQSGLYDGMFLQMVRVGEETGALDAMLVRIAEYYDLDVETALAALAATLEPALILLLGGAVGFIVAALFIPLYALIGSIK